MTKLVESDIARNLIEERTRMKCAVSARENGWVLNPDKKKLEAVYKGLVRNMVLWGKMYCPCVIIKVVPEKERVDYICPCKKAKTQIETDSICKCRLFCKNADMETS